jgi:hypothetical protein
LSVLAGESYIQQYIAYHEMIETSKHYLSGIATIDPLWFLEMAPGFF